MNFIVLERVATYAVVIFSVLNEISFMVLNMSSSSECMYLLLIEWVCISALERNADGTVKWTKVILHLHRCHWALFLMRFLLLVFRMFWVCPLPSNAESNKKQILRHFPRWVECESGRASWKQMAPVFSEGLVQVAAFEITIQLPGNPPFSEAATGTSFGNYSQVRSWNYSVTWTTGGFSFSGEEEGSMHQ